jgi:hypothetical protein
MMGLGASSPNRVTTSYRIILTVFPYVTFTVVVIVRRLPVHGRCRECNRSPMYRQSAGAHDGGDVDAFPGNPLVLRGARNVRTLSAAFIADLQEDWEKYGTQILELMREKFPDLYFASIVKLAQIVRIEADVSLKEPKPKTIEEVLQRVDAGAVRRSRCR